MEEIRLREIVREKDKGTEIEIKMINLVDAREVEADQDILETGIMIITGRDTLNRGVDRQLVRKRRLETIREIGNDVVQEVRVRRVAVTVIIVVIDEMSINR